MMRVLAAVVVLMLPTASYAQRIVLPNTVQGQPGTFIMVSPSSYDGDDITWLVLDPGLTMVPPELLARHDTAVLMAGQNGSYRVAAVTAKVVGGKAAISPISVCLVVVGTGPGPGPLPPPPQPDPTDALFPSLKAAFATDSGKTSDAKALAAIYRNAGTAMSDPRVKTVGDLNAVMHAAAEANLPGKLLQVRRALANEVNIQVKTPGTALLTDAIKTQYTIQFNRFALLLEFLGR